MLTGGCINVILLKNMFYGKKLPRIITVLNTSSSYTFKERMFLPKILSLQQTKLHLHRTLHPTSIYILWGSRNPQGMLSKYQGICFWLQNQVLSIIVAGARNLREPLTSQPEGDKHGFKLSHTTRKQTPTSDRKWTAQIISFWTFHSFCPLKRRGTYSQSGDHHVI